jgi:hypothetical protein
MALPTPTLTELANFSGRLVDDFTPFAAMALGQGALLIGLRMGFTELPTDPTEAQMVKYAVLALGYQLYLEQPYAEVRANPFSSETIGSSSYSKSPVSLKAMTSNPPTGNIWLDFLLRYFYQSGVASSSVSVFENDNVMINSETGQRTVLGPHELITPYMPYEVRSQQTHDVAGH